MRKKPECTVVPTAGEEPLERRRGLPVLPATGWLWRL